MARAQFPREFIGRKANSLVPIHLVQSNDSQDVCLLFATE